MSIIDSFISRAEEREVDKKSGNKFCYLFPSYALLLGNSKLEDVQYVKERSEELLKQGVNIVPILEYKAVGEVNDLGYQKTYILQKRAVGEELHDKPNKEQYEAKMASLAQENQDFYDKYVFDFIKIEESGLRVDPSKSSNYFYEKGKAISFIDLNKISRKKIDNKFDYKEMATVLLGGGAYFSFAGEQGSQTQKNAENVLNKLKISFVKNGYDALEIDKDIEERFPDTVPANKRSQGESISRDREFEW